MSGEQAVMRTTLLPGLLGAVRENLDQQNYPVTVFEQGRVYVRDELGHARRPRVPPSHAASSRPSNPRMLGVALCGPLRRRGLGSVALAKPISSR